MKTSRTALRAAALFALFATSTAFVDEARAARAMNAVVEVDGEPVFDAFLTDDGIPPLSGVTVWRYLDEARFVPLDEDSDLSADPRDVTLRGAIVVRIDHGGRAGHRVEVGELTLMHGRREEAEGWYLPMEWVREHEPPGDVAEETRTIARRRWVESLRIPTTLATVAAAGLGCVLAIVVLAMSLAGRQPGRAWIVAAVVLCAVSLACSVTAWCTGSELFAGPVWPIPIAAAAGLGAGIVTGTRPRS